MTSTSFGRSQGHEATRRVLNRERKIVLNRLWKCFEIHHIIAKTFDVVCHVRTEHGQFITGNTPPFLDQPFEDFAQLKGIIQDDRVGKQINILDVFLAFFCGKRLDLAIIAKREPFAEGVELLHFIGRLVNDFAQFGIRDIL